MTDHRWKRAGGWLVALGIVAIAVTWAPGADAAEPDRLRVNVSGSFVTKSGTPVEGAEVKLLDDSLVPIIGTTTDSAGGFLLEEIVPGTYSISVTVEGFEVTPRVRKGKRGDLPRIEVQGDGTLSPSLFDVLYKEPKKRGMWMEILTYILLAVAAAIAVF